MYVREDNIFWFQVPMYDILTMHLLNAFTNLEKLLGGFALFELLVFLHQRVERPLLHVLHQHVEVLLVREVSIHLHQLRMVEIHLDLHFLDELIHHEPDRLLLYFFQGA